MKRLNVLKLILVQGCLCIGLSGCSDSEQPEKTIPEKLGSDDSAEVSEGLDEANEKFGGKP